MFISLVLLSKRISSHPLAEIDQNIFCENLSLGDQKFWQKRYENCIQNTEKS